jgi:LCP family protein required for cell wall assembly
MRNPFKKRKADPLAAGMFRSVRTREKRHRLTFVRRKWVLISFVILVVVGALGGYGLWLYFSFQGDVQDEDTVLDNRVERPDAPFNVLLVGSDSREGLTEEEQQRLGADDQAGGVQITGERADTLILSHIDPETQKVTMVQFPRDLYIERADGTEGRINEALQVGRTALINTVEGVTGLQISHYVQVNIAGFRDVVDAIGGVEVCVAEAIPFDPATGIEVTEDEVGMVEFDGDRAVRFVRSRKAFGEGDLARIQNQQKFLAAAINKITSPATFLSLGKILDLKNVAGKNLAVDRDTDLRELYRILQRFRSFDPKNYEAYTVPNLGPAEITTDSGVELSVVEPDSEAMEVMFDAIARNESPASADTVPDIDPATIRVAVLNGTGEEGVAQEAADALVAATRRADGAITVEEVANAARSSYKQTVLVFDEGTEAENMAEYLAAAIPGARLKEGATALGVDVEVIVGRRFETERIVQILPLPIPVPGELPEVCRT